jgi:hypothetical protein
MQVTHKNIITQWEGQCQKNNKIVTLHQVNDMDVTKINTILK